MFFFFIFRFVWKIHSDGEHITDDPLKVPEEVDFNNIDLNDKSLIETFFESFFPSVKGHAALIDKYHQNASTPYYHTVIRNDSLKFHDDDADDPDWKVKQAYTLLIAAANEHVSGTENLWRHGDSRGCHDFPDFGQYMSLIQFKLFIAAAPYCWCDPEHWFTDKRDKPWSIFLPCLQGYNAQRRKLLKSVMLLMLDESMSGWRPKTSRLGGLPNISFEPRKPIPLGTMFKNGVECLSGIIVFQDVVQSPDMQAHKEFFDEPSSMPGDAKIPAHTAETLRQVQGAGVQKGGWVGGDSWFGSVTTAVECMNRLGVHSTFVIKNNQNFYPMRALSNILNARHGEGRAGHWVVMSTEIAGVKMFALAYAWSQRGISYFLSTCGKTTPHPVKYQTHFEDAYGNTTFREIDRPHVAHFLYDYLPLIDEHNKQRQSLLALEESWPTKDCWFRLLTTLLGMCVVDMHRYYRSHKLIKEKVRQSEVDQVRIRRFSDMLCKDLKLNLRTRNLHIPRNEDAGSEYVLERIRDKNGSTTRPPTDKQVRQGKHVGTACNKMCFICRKYRKVDGSTVQQQTTFCCKKCKMPLCKKDRSDIMKGRNESCAMEHSGSADQTIGCFGIHVDGCAFPSDKQVNLNPRRSVRK